MDLVDHRKRLSELHSRTKHYLLIAEELSEDGDVFLQPLKEHRDAYDHIMRAYDAEFRSDFKTEDDRIKYIDKNMDKAYGHEYRAFFDTADWLSFICRRYIRMALKSQSPKVLSKFNEYDDIKNLINSIPVKIAELREGKDIANSSENNNPKTTKTLVEDYCKVLDQLINAYIIVRSRFGKT